MNEPILIIDVDGALFQSRPFHQAHRQWFELFATILKDESILLWIGKENYFEGIHDIMQRYLGATDQNAQTVFARNIYAMLLVREVEQTDLVTEFVEYLKTLKSDYSGYRLAIVTTIPQLAVDPILRKVGCENLFDITLKSPMGSYPNKRNLMIEFIEEYGTPSYYIGQADKDIAMCTELGIRTIVVEWTTPNVQNIQATHIIKTVNELKSILRQGQ